MPLDHYLPATHLASFSTDSSGPRRERRLVVGDLVENHIFTARAAGVCAQNDFYTLIDNKNPRLLDSIWADYEANLDGAVTALLNRSIDAQGWARILVPFIAGILVRGPDFNRRFEDRLRLLGVDSHLPPDNTNEGRMFELQRLLAPVLAARWLVMATRGEGVVIENDIGFLPFANFETADSGLAIPINLNHILILIPCRRRVVAVEAEGTWFPFIEYGELDRGNHISLNAVLASSAYRFIFGPDEPAIILFLGKPRTHRMVPEPAFLGFISGPLAAVHEFAWHQLVTILAYSPFYPDNDKSIDWQQLDNGWSPPVYFPGNLPKYPPSVQRVDNKIIVDLYDVPGFTL